MMALGEHLIFIDDNGELNVEPITTLTQDEIDRYHVEHNRWRNATDADWALWEKVAIEKHLYHEPHVNAIDRKALMRLVYCDLLELVWLQKVDDKPSKRWAPTDESWYHHRMRKG